MCGNGKILEELKRIEFQEIHYDQPDPDYFGFIRGEIPVMVSAPHGAVHFRTREKRWKGEDEYTSSLAIVLGRLTGAHVIYLRNRACEDPNNDDNTRYKDFIRQAVGEYGIRFLIDLHGADPAHGFKVDVGTISDELPNCSCPGCREIIAGAFSGFDGGLFNRRFQASRPCTVTSFAWRQLGVESAQFEISAEYRVVERKPDSAKARAGLGSRFRADGEKVLTLVSRMERMILEIARRMEADSRPCRT